MHVMHMHVIYVAVDACWEVVRFFVLTKTLKKKRTYI